eukprot:TRINITY_DN4384_c0_g1_i1.p1 TRINITY_DN4384_c0_g1~~TRINITY_DN4384_c0_g1_i1.p1  ORF type:complete len:354 (+),score=57.62 TRINITY_DN4384_c0_g1_i1:33-1064(+)
MQDGWKRLESPAIHAAGLRGLLELSTEYPALNELARVLPPMPFKGIHMLTCLKQKHHKGLNMLNNSTFPGLDVVYKSLENESEMNGLAVLKMVAHTPPCLTSSRGTSSRRYDHVQVRNSTFPGLDVVYKSLENENESEMNGLAVLKMAAHTPPCLISSRGTGSRRPTPPVRPISKGSRKGSGRRTHDLPPVARPRRGSELYSPLDFLASKRRYINLDTPKGRTAFANSLKKHPTNTMSIESVPDVKIPEHEPVLPTVTQYHVSRKKTVLQAISTKENALRGELQNIISRRHERQLERKQRHDKKKKMKFVHLPTLPETQRQEDGRGKLLHEICIRYKQRGITA